MRRQINGELLKGLSNELNEPNKTTAKQWQTYKCTLVTPMYGGGVEAGKVDKDMPIRASSIRGQLRFWWRIACGPFKSPKEMFDKETEIWGGIGAEGAKASQVDIRVSCSPINSGQLTASDKISTDKKNKWGVNYVLGAGDPANCLDSGYEFKIYIHYSSYPSSTISEEVLKENVTKALRWWATFGGVGAKTRRGFGAIEVQGVESILSTDFSEKQTSKGCLLMLANEPYFNAKDAWQLATLRLQEFRQGKNLGRDPGSNKPVSRSRWPEPDQLRRMTKHKKGHEPVHKAGNVFPRAAFGMPIIFDFNDRSKTEPKTMTLLPKDAQRMASPLIIRPYKNGDQWQAAALLLPTWQTALHEPLELSPAPKNCTPNHWPTCENERTRLAEIIRPMVGKDGQLRANDPLSAFLDYFKQGQ